jgi:hypothetical protein
MSAYSSAVLTTKSPGAEGNPYGFEGSRVVKVGSTYHLFTTEMTGEPRFVKTKLAHWISDDRVHWRRESTLFESTADLSGRDPRASLWAPMPVFDDHANRWEIFYVGYRAEPEGSPYPPKSSPAENNPHLFHVAPQDLNPHIFYNYNGTIWRAVSTNPGSAGISGPYRDAGIVLHPGPDSQPWEGIQGTDSFFPYRVGNTWYAFYGSCHCESLSRSAWQVGLASAPTLAAQWTRLPTGNPVLVDPHFVENPIVAQLTDGTFVVVYNGPQADGFGYATSNDGMHWGEGRSVSILPAGVEHWAQRIRTPLGLIAEEDGTYTLFFTAFMKSAKGTAFTGEFSSGMSFATFRVEIKHDNPQ